MMNSITQVSNQTLGSRLPWEIGEKGSLNLPEEEYLNPEQLNHLNDLADDKISQQQAEQQEKKTSIWQTAISQSYIESQKQTLDAYVTSATGESLYENDNDDSMMSLMDSYITLMNFQAEKYGQSPVFGERPDTVKPLPKKEDEASIQPVMEQKPAAVMQYQAMQQAKGQQDSLMHLIA